MEIHVSQLLKSAIGATRTYETEPGTIEGDQTIRYGPGRVKLIRTANGILAEALVPVSTNCTCARCLEPFECSVRIRFSEEFFPTVDVNSGTPITVEDREAFRIDAHHILDLDEAIRQYTVVGLPMQPVCREDCAGLCPVCGQPRNREACNCQVAEVDPRLAPLAALLRQKEQGA